MNSDHVQTIREALKVYEGESWFLPEAQGDTVRFEVRAALTALDEAAGWELISDGWYDEKWNQVAGAELQQAPDTPYVCHVHTKHGERYLMDYYEGRKGESYTIGGVVGLFRKRQPAQEGDA